MPKYPKPVRHEWLIRPAFGRGWEAHRMFNNNFIYAVREICNPYEPGSQQHEWFQNGWNQFTDVGLLGRLN